MDTHAAAIDGARRVLIVDDEVTIRMALRRFFTRLGWAVEEACDGETALDLLDGEARNFTGTGFIVTTPPPFTQNLTSPRYLTHAQGELDIGKKVADLAKPHRQIEDQDIEEHTQQGSDVPQNEVDQRTAETGGQHRHPPSHRAVTGLTVIEAIFEEAGNGLQGRLNETCRRQRTKLLQQERDYQRKQGHATGGLGWPSLVIPIGVDARYHQTNPLQTAFTHRSRKRCRLTIIPAVAPQMKYRP